MNLKYIRARNKKALVVVAHPDDEAYGMGGTLHKLLQIGFIVRVLVCYSSCPLDMDRGVERMERYYGYHKQVCYSPREFWTYVPDQLQLSALNHSSRDENPTRVFQLEPEIRKTVHEVNPLLVFTHSSCDLDEEHQVVAGAVRTALRPQNFLTQSKVPDILTFHVPGCTVGRPFSPSVFVALDENNVNVKLKAALRYGERTESHPCSSRSLKSSASHYGVLMGSAYAEAFELESLRFY